ncbi:hypothetical protein BKI52_21505 [marine bacterium AO1-C]|nr:hypothetical protein BKI52_21505 [marine bacterium AO1-C]
MKNTILFLVTFSCLSNFALAQQDSLKTQQSNTFVQFKVGGGLYFLNNTQITEVYRTNSFFIPTIGLELIGKNIGFYLDVASTLTANVNVDTVGAFRNPFNFRQTHINAGLLNRAKLNSNVFFRGKLGLSYMSTVESFFEISDQGLAATIGAGLEFQVSSSSIYFVEMNYLYKRTRETGSLGGLNLTMGFKFGRIQ